MEKKNIRVVILTQEISDLIISLVLTGDVVGVVEARKRHFSKENTILKIYRKYFKTRLTLQTLAKKYDIPYFYMEYGCDNGLEKWVKNLSPDLMIVYSMSELLTKKIFSIPQYGTINLHPSLLPNYRGANPVFWMYYYMDLEPGVTVHFIDEGEDTGAIIYQEKVKIPLGLKNIELNNILINSIGKKLILKILQDIKHIGSVQQYPQIENNVVYKARRILDEEYDKLIQWDKWEIERVWHLLRGTEDYLNVIKQPTGIMIGQRWCILDFVKCSMDGYSAGEIYKENNSCFLACRDGKINMKIEFSFKKMMLSLLMGKNNGQ